MIGMDGMPWMRMPDQTEAGVAAGFVAMWALMMVPMMSPVVAPQLVACRRDFGVYRALSFAIGYFAVWSALGVPVYIVGRGWLEATVRFPGLAQAVPWLTSASIAAVGVLQFSGWKRRALGCCRRGPDLALPAWRAGLMLGIRCVQCCANLTLLLLVLGVMDLRVMGLVTAIIAVERLAPHGERWARRIGAMLALVGVLTAV